MRLLARLTLAVLVPALVACHRGPSTTDLSPPPSRATLRSMPGWYLKPPRDAQYVFGAATAVSQDLQIAIDKAQAEGRNLLAQQLEVKYASLTSASPRRPDARWIRSCSISTRPSTRRR